MLMSSSDFKEFHHSNAYKLYAYKGVPIEFISFWFDDQHDKG